MLWAYNLLLARVYAVNAMDAAPNSVSVL
jgi:hypothetical protein